MPVEDKQRRGYADEVAVRLIKHARWMWSPGIVIRWAGKHLIVVKVTDHETIYCHFLGQTTGVELGLQEHNIFPDLLSPITAGVLFERWARVACFGSIRTDRFRLVGPRPNRQMRIRTLTGAWALVIDTGSQLMTHSHDDLGVAVAESMLGLFTRLDHMTPQRLKAITREFLAPSEGLNKNQV